MRTKHLFKNATAAVILASATLAQATLIDLTGPVVANRTGTDNGVVYTWIDAQSTGTGVFPSFVQMGVNSGFEQGYNTTVNNTFNNQSSDQHNHELTFGAVGVTQIGGIDYVGFILDINQTGDNPLITLDDLQLFISTSPNQG